MICKPLVCDLELFKVKKSDLYTLGVRFGTVQRTKVDLYTHSV